MTDTQIIPVPQVPISFRIATMADLPFLDAMQNRFKGALGYFPTKQFQGYIEMGAVLVAEDVTGHSSLVTRGQLPEAEGPASDKGQVTNDIRLGYVSPRE